MEGICFFLGLTGPLQQLLDIVAHLKARMRAYRSNDRELRRAHLLYEKLSRQLADLRTCYELAVLNTAVDFTDRLVASLSNSEQQVSEALHDIIRRTNAQQTRSKAAKFARAISMRDDIAKLFEQASLVEQLIRETTGQALITSVTTRGFESVLAELHQLREQVQAHDHVMGSVSRRMVAAGFTAKLLVTRNAAWVHLDFELKDDSGDLITTEGKLKSVLMNGSQGACVDGFRYTRIDLIGKGGVGKSCAVRGLAQDSDVRSHFYDTDSETCGGIYSVFLANDVQECQLKEQLARIVQITGDWVLAMQIRQEQIFFLCVARVIEWLRNRNCLFLINIAFEDNPFGETLAEYLFCLSACSYGSACIFSRRISSTKPMGKVIRIDADPGAKKMSRRNLLFGAGCSEKDVADEMTKSTVQDILKICNDLRITTGIAGTSVRRIKENRRCDNVNAWQHYKSLLDEAIKKHALDVSEVHRSMDSVFSVAIRLRQEQVRDEDKHIINPELIPKRYRSLCVSQSEWTPFEMLRDLWGLDSMTHVNEICKHFNHGRLGFIETRTINGIDLTGFRIHDFLREYAVREAVKHGEMESWREKRTGCTIEETAAALIVT